MQDKIETLDTKSLSTLKNFNNPPHCISNACFAICVLLNEEPSWSQFKKIVSADLINKLKDFDYSSITDKQLKALKPYIEDSTFNEENLYKENHSAEIFCHWTLAVIKMFNITKEVISYFTLTPF